MRRLTGVSVEIRASDDDRHRVIDALHKHTEAGRLDLDEFSDRVGAVYAARTLAELAALTRDLPAEPAAPAQRLAPAPGTAAAPAAGGAGEAAGSGAAGRRDLLLLFVVAAVTLVLLGVFMAVSR